MFRAAEVASVQRALVERARSGDLEAFTQLVEMAFPRLKGVAYLILRDADRAEDAVQEALVAAWQDLRALRDPDAWDAWLRRLLVRTCYRLAKKHRRHAQVQTRVGRDPGTTRSADATAGVAEREWILEELGRIDVEKRSVIVLHYYLDLPMGEVAEILDIPYGTAASRLHRGLELMRASMYGVTEPDGSVEAERQS
jgi:RNA polymerase sigma factor (sigma-70 family)